MGVVAAKSVFDEDVTIHQMEGVFHFTPFCSNTLVTIHPSAVLRFQDHDDREIQYARFVGHLKVAVAKLRELTIPKRKAA